MILPALCRLDENPHPLQLAALPDPGPGPARSWCACRRAGCATPSWTRSRGARRRPGCRSCLGHQVVGRVAALGRGAAPFTPGTGWASAGFTPPAARANSAGRARITSARLSRHGPRRERRLCRVHGRAGALRPPHPGRLHRCRGRAAALRRRHRLPVAAAHGPRDGQSLGLTGFGASAHLVLQMARHRFPASYSLSLPEGGRKGNSPGSWARPGPGIRRTAAPGNSHCIIDTTPAWRPVVAALATSPGGRLVINAIRKENAGQKRLLTLDYPAHLWLEKEIKSVANVSRADISEFLHRQPRSPSGRRSRNTHWRTPTGRSSS